MLTREAFENAIAVNAAIGGSTNAVIHLTAVARRMEVPLDIEDWHRVGRDVPTLLNLQPSGRYLMQDFHEAGGLPVILRDMCESGLLHGDALTVTGRTLAKNNAGAVCWNPDVIHSVAKPFMAIPCITPSELNSNSGPTAMPAHRLKELNSRGCRSKKSAQLAAAVLVLMPRDQLFSTVGRSGCGPGLNVSASGWRTGNSSKSEKMAWSAPAP